MPTTVPWTHHRARVARATQTGDTVADEQARRDLKAARAEDYVRRLVESWPPLTDEQLDVLARLIRPVESRARGERDTSGGPA